MSMRVDRLSGNPIVHGGMPGLEGEPGENINGPCLVRVPEWVADPLGKYYLYFGHHAGTFIRLAYADRIAGPWTIHAPGVLHLDRTACHGHVASPDVHVDHECRRLRMYFHGGYERPGGARNRYRQHTFVAESEDGVQFEARDTPLAPFYLRVFRHDAWHYGIAKHGDACGLVLRSPDGLRPFRAGPRIIPRMRHAAVWKRGAELIVFFSRIGDCPERILATRIDLSGDWRRWRPSGLAEVLQPETQCEGSDLPEGKSRPGAAEQPERALRDPFPFCDEGRLYLLYSVAGEQGIAVAAFGAESDWAPVWRDDSVRMTWRAATPAGLKRAWWRAAGPAVSAARYRATRAARFTRPPIVIGGCGRSGTTLLLSILSAHPAILAIPYETQAFCRSVYSRGFVWRPLQMERIYRYLNEHAVPGQCTRWCEKTPGNVLYYGRILRRFGGEVRILNVVRDGRDVITSRHPTDPSGYWVSPERWTASVRAGRKWEGHKSVMTLRYEDVVTDFERSIERICAFMSEPCADEIRDWYRHTQVRRNAAWVGQIGPAHRRSIGRWRQPEHAARVAQLMRDPAAVDLLRHYGYVTGNWKLET